MNRASLWRWRPRSAAIVFATAFVGCSAGPGDDPALKGAAKPGDAAAVAKPDAGSPAPKSGSGPKLLFVTNTYSDWWAAVEKGMNDGASEFGAQAQMRKNLKGETARQIELLEEALSLDDVKGVAVSVVDAKAQGVAKVLKRIKDSGKVVITIDSDLAEGSQDLRRAYIGTNNRKAGEAAGKAAAAIRPEGGKVAVFVGIPSAANAVERREGFFAGAGDKFSQAEVFADKVDKKLAGDNVQIATSKHPDLGVLLGLWSYNAPAIASFVSRSPEVRKKVSVVTFDLDENAIPQVEQGLIDATVCQNPYDMGHKAVRLLKALIEKDEATVSEMLPGGTAIIDTGVRIVVPKSDSPVKGDNVIDVKAMKEWLGSKGLKST